MTDIALRVENLGKRYRLGVEQGGIHRYKSLRDSLVGMARRPVQALRSTVIREPMNESNSFWALKDINLEVKKGEVVGIIGRNGAGKSTLLKILSRITKPTAGYVALYGRVGSLLEVGTGFHPELTGRENIYLNGAILGMTGAEVKSRFDEIVAFSEIEKFLDTAVKHYSSGMYMRLAFAVAAHLEPEILVVDEVLAVGDAEFQKKCLGKMKDVAGEGRTVLFVSHNMAAVEGLCSSGLLLSSGKVLDRGSIAQVVSRYAQMARSRAHPTAAPRLETRDGYSVEIERIDQPGATGSDDLEICLRVFLPGTVQRFGVGLHVYAADGYKIARLWPAYCLPEFGPQCGALRLRIRLAAVSQSLAAGHYRVDISLHDTHTTGLLHFENAFELDVPERDVMGTGYAFRFPDSGIVPLSGSGEILTGADLAGGQPPKCE